MHQYYDAPLPPHIEDTLRDWINYYHATRAVGHTHVALHGAESVARARVVVHNSSFGKTLHHTPKSGAKIVVYNHTDMLRGLNAPVVWDNCALTDVFIRSTRRIEWLKSEVERMKAQIEVLQYENSRGKRIVKTLQDRLTRVGESLKRLFRRTH